MIFIASDLQFHSRRRLTKAEVDERVGYCVYRDVGLPRPHPWPPVTQSGRGISNMASGRISK